MAFDLDGNGQVDVAELKRAIDAIAVANQTEALPEPQRQPRKADCVLPAAPADAQIVLLSGYEGAAISSVAMSGLDQETTTAILTIEEGEAPLYIIAGSFESMAWLVEGDVSRVVRFVGQAGIAARAGAGVGVVGLNPSVVSFVPRASCFDYFSKASDGKASIAQARLAAEIGRGVDHLIASYTLDQMAVPSGTGTRTHRDFNANDLVKRRSFVVTENGPVMQEVVLPVPEYRPEGVSAEMWASTSNYFAGSVITINPDDVISPAPVVAYDVLPQRPGLMQLIREGSIVETDDRFFRIVKPIARFPAGLNGGHSVKFLLGKGVPVPDGSPGHSSVISEETGECVANTHCR